MKKRFLYPIWKLDEIEKELVILEENGWRLYKIRGIRSFEFVKSTPKTVKYFFTYSLTREKLNMNIIENTLEQNFNANEIQGNFIEGLGITSVYRITKQVDLDEQLSDRNFILQYCLFKRIIYGLIFLLLPLIPLAIGLIINAEKLFNDIIIPFNLAIFVGYFVPVIINLIYNIVGFIYFKKSKIQKSE